MKQTFLRRDFLTGLWAAGGALIAGAGVNVWVSESSSLTAVLFGSTASASATLVNVPRSISVWVTV